MFLEYIERARSQPKEVKQRIVWVWSIALTGIIVLVWLSIIMGKQYAEQGSVDSGTTVETAPVDTSSQFRSANQFLNAPQPSPVKMPAVFESTGTTSSSTATSTVESGEQGTYSDTRRTPQLWP